MARLTGTAAPVQLAGYQLRAPGFTGDATFRDDAPTSRGETVPVVGQDAYHRALRKAGLKEASTIQLTLRRERGGNELTRGEGDLQGQPSVELTVPAFEGQRFVVMAVDDSGIITWNFPEAQTAGEGSRGADGAGHVFRIPVFSGQASGAATAAGERGIVADIAGKILKVLFFPVIKRGIKTYALNWENKNRPARLRTITGQNVNQPSSTSTSLDTKALRALADGPALLFVHGTFSRTDAAFGAFKPEFMTELHRRYGGRVFSFDHPSVSVDPTVNAQWFVNSLPAGSPVTLDIVAHSRGGLVARAIARELSTQGRGQVRRLVFVGTPNQGTPLADPQHMVSMLNRISTLLNLAPPNVAALTAVLESVLVVVKLVGQAALEGLDGLGVMNPDTNSNHYITELDKAALNEIYVMTSNYEPKGSLRELVRMVDDAARDYVFGNAPNDMVVPTAGVAGKLLVKDKLEFGPADSIEHSGFFSDPRAVQTFLKWLT